MAEDRIEVVREALDAIGRRDLQAILERVDEEIVLHPLLSVWPRTYEGHAGIRQWWEDVDELWESFRLDAEDFREEEDGSLVVRVRWRGRARGMPGEVDGPAVAVVRFRGDKPSSVDIHLDEKFAPNAAADP